MTRSNSSGVVFIEVSIIILTIIIIIVGSLEISSVYRKQQAVLSVSQQIGNEIFRACFNASANGVAATNDCMANKFGVGENRLEWISPEYLGPDSKVVFKVFFCQGSNVDMALYTSDPKLNIRSSTPDMLDTSEGSFHSLCIKRKRIFVSEAYTPYPSVLGKMAAVVGSIIQPETGDGNAKGKTYLHAVTIF